MTIKPLIENFLTYLQTQGKRPTTAYNYRHYLDKFVDFTGDIEIEKLGIREIIEFQNFIAGQELANSTKSFYSVALRSFLTFCHRQGLIIISPTAVQLPKYRRTEMTFLTSEELKAILEAANPRKKLFKEFRDRAILEVLASSGLRVSEVASLKVGDLNLEKRELLVKNGKNGKDRLGFLSKDAAYYLGKYLADRKYQDEDFVFYVPNSDKNITSRSIQRLVIKYAKRAGIKKSCHPHMFRHGLATQLLQRGADIRSVQEILGHSSITTTTAYTHVTNEGLHKAYDLAQNPFSVKSNGEPYKNEFIVLSKQNFNQLIGHISKNRQLLFKICKKFEISCE